MDPCFFQKATKTYQSNENSSKTHRGWATVGRKAESGQQQHTGGVPGSHSACSSGTRKLFSALI